MLGDGSTPSPVAGLVLIKAAPDPPPMNSLPPRRCPPERGAIGILARVEEGDSGGLFVPDSRFKDSDGLNEKLGSCCGPDLRAVLAPSAPTFNIDPNPEGSIADNGLLPVALEKDNGADDDTSRAGKTNGGLGRGGPEGFGTAEVGKEEDSCDGDELGVLL